MLIPLQGLALGSGADVAGNMLSHAGARTRQASPFAKGGTTPAAAWLATVRRHITQREYRPSANAAGLQAPSRRHAFRTYFEPTGIRVVDRVVEGSPQLLELRLEQMGRSHSLASVTYGEVASNGARIEIRRSSLLEWYLNGPAGLEQGFTVSKRPEGDGPLLLELSLKGAQAFTSGEAVRIVTATGRKLTYAQLKAVDAAGDQLPVRLSVPSAHHIQLQVDDTSARYPIVIDPLLAADAATQLESDQRGALFGFSVAGAGDVNGDGYDDVIVGAWRYDAGETDEGAAFIFHGSANGIADATPATAHTRLESNQVGAWMGVSVGGAGDVNGDGYDDVIVGARRYDAGETDEGAAFVFYGSAAGIANGTPATARTRLEGNQADAWMGHAVDGAGDVNGDGYADVIVGAMNYDTGASFLGRVHHFLKGTSDEGATFLFLGSASGIGDASPASADAVFENVQWNANMGYGASGAGDVNGDGYADVIVGAYQYSCGQIHEGAAFVFLGGEADGYKQGRVENRIFTSKLRLRRTGLIFH